MFKKFFNTPLRHILAPKVAGAGLLMMCLFVLMSCVTQPTTSQQPSFRISSPDFKDGQALTKHNESAASARGCHGDNVAPTLQWIDAPYGTQSFALTMYDVDANHTHWTVFNIPSNQHEVRDHPPYSQGLNTAQQAGYTGPCPTPNGKPHHYVFTLYALSVATIQGDKTITYEQLLQEITPYVVGKTSMVGTFSRTSNT